MRPADKISKLLIIVASCWWGGMAIATAAADPDFQIVDPAELNVSKKSVEFYKYGKNGRLNTKDGYLNSYHEIGWKDSKQFLLVTYTNFPDFFAKYQEALADGSFLKVVRHVENDRRLGRVEVVDPPDNDFETYRGHDLWIDSWCLPYECVSILLIPLRCLACYRPVRPPRAVLRSSAGELGTIHGTANTVTRVNKLVVDATAGLFDLRFGRRWLLNGKGISDSNIQQVLRKVRYQSGPAASVPPPPEYKNNYSDEPTEALLPKE